MEREGRIRGVEYLENDEEQVRLEETLKVKAVKRLVSPAGGYE